MKRIILFFLLICSISQLMAEEIDSLVVERPGYVARINLLGEISIASFTFEGVKFVEPGFGFTIGGGFGYLENFSFFSEVQSFFTIHLNASLIIGKNRSFLEGGLGIGAINGPYSRVLAYPSIGYRLHPLKNTGFSFRIGLSYPLLQDADVLSIFPTYISLGYAF